MPKERDAQRKGASGDDPAGVHFSAKEFADLVANRLPGRRRHQLVRHMVRGCVACSKISARVLASTRKEGVPQLPLGINQAEFDLVFTNATSATELRDRQLAWERLQAWVLWCELEPLPPAERQHRVRHYKEFHTWGMYERLLEASVWHRHNDPAEAVDIVKLAVLVAENMPSSHIPGRAGGRTRLLARAWTHLANAMRVAADFDDARRALNQAWGFWEDAHDPETEARIYSVEASYHSDRGDFAMAEIVGQQALDIYTALGAEYRHEQGQTLLTMGVNLIDANPRKGMLFLRRSLGLVDLNREPRLHLYGKHSIAACLAALRQGEAALAALEEVRPLYRQYDDDAFIQLRLHWLEGRVVRCLGKPVEAAQVFAQVAEQFRALDMRHETVLAALDQAEALAAQGDFDAAQRALEEVTPLMTAWRLNTYLVAAWLLLINALKTHQTVDLFPRLQLYFSLRWKAPVEFVANPEPS